MLASGKFKPSDEPTVNVSEIYQGPASGLEFPSDPYAGRGLATQRAMAYAANAVLLAASMAMGSVVSPAVSGPRQSVFLVHKDVAKDLPTGGTNALSTLVTISDNRPAIQTVTVAYDDTPVVELRRLNYEEGVLRVLRLKD